MNQAIKLLPHDHDKYIKRSFIFCEYFSHYHLAIDDATMAINVNPMSYAGYLRKGISLLKLHKYFEAYSQFEIAYHLATPEIASKIKVEMDKINNMSPQQKIQSLIHKKGKRILALDGGGMKGLAMIEMLAEMERKTGKQIYELFDMVCGTSTGGLLAMAIYCKLDMQRCKELYLRLGKRLFDKSSKKNLPPWYDGNKLIQIIREEFGDIAMVDCDDRPKIFVVGANVSQNPPVPHLYRNYKFQEGIPFKYAGTYGSTLYEAGRITSAAPVYFESYEKNNITFYDGALVANNPAQIAFDEARLLWGSDLIDVIVSLGTGRSLNPPKPMKETLPGFIRSFLDSNLSGALDVVDMFKRFVSLITSSETTHQAMKALTTLCGIRYWRYNPPITKLDLDETDQQKLDNLIKETRIYLFENNNAFDHLCSFLL